MAVQWICPACSGEMYIAWPRQGEPEVICIYCARRFENPYFEGKEGAGEAGGSR